MIFPRRPLVFRLISATALWCLALTTLLTAWEPGLFLLILGLSLAALWEAGALLASCGPAPGRRVLLALGAIILGVAFLTARGSDFQAWSQASALALPVSLTALFLSEFRTTAPERSLRKVAAGLLALAYVPVQAAFLYALLYVGTSPGSSPTGNFFVLYLLVVTKIGDTGAYLAGTLCGRHQMAPAISPKKSWEGLAGALVFAVGSSVAMTTFLPEQLGAIRAPHCWILGILLGSVGAAGDLAESLLKRAAGVKDSGRMLPGIGGALDLLDSVLPTAPLLCAYLHALGSARS